MIDGVLLDIDGVLAVSWEPLPGAVETIRSLRAADVPFRLITNTTTKTRAALGENLRGVGFDVADDEIVTAVVATAAYMRTAHPGAKVFVLSDGDATPDLDGIDLVDVEDADVVVLGGACDDFTYPMMNRVFRRLMGGAILVGMHRNLYWRTKAGLELDGGAYIAGLEEAAGTTAVICGKPARAYYESALRLLGVPRDRVAMVGDDVVSDVHGAQAAGLTGILVRSGKYRDGDERNAQGLPDHVLDSIGDLVAHLGTG